MRKQDLMEERPARQWRNGSGLSILFASDTPASLFQETGAMPLAIAGEGRSVGLSGPGARIPGDELLDSNVSAPPNETVLGMRACPWMVRKPVEQGTKVRRLLKTARLDRRRPWTPPISMYTIWSANTHKAISLNAHCLSRAWPGIVETAWVFLEH